MNVYDKAPIVDKDAFVAPSASIIGDVRVGHGSSIWYGCVLRGKMPSRQCLPLAPVCGRLNQTVSDCFILASRQCYNGKVSFLTWCSEL